MKNRFLSLLMIIVLVIVFNYALGLYFPWWTIAIGGFIAGAVVPAKYGIAFLGGLIGGFLLWGGLAYFISSANQDILAHRISMLIIKQDSPLKLILITGGIGAIVCGVAALSGSILRSLFIKP